MTSVCYTWHSDSNATQALDPNTWVPCPEGIGCCVSGDYCTNYGICRSVAARELDNPNLYSQYYVQRCSDPTYTSPNCPKVCNDPQRPDAVYIYSDEQWACCGQDSTGNVTCNAPTDEIFQAPPPDQLATISAGVIIAATATIVPGSKILGGTTNSSSTTVTSAPTTTSTSSLSTSAPSQSDDLSVGVKAGIGAGVAAFIIAIVTIATFLWLRRRKRRLTTTTIDVNDKNDDEDTIHETHADSMYPELEVAGYASPSTNVGPNHKHVFQDEQRYELDSDR